MFNSMWKNRRLLGCGLSLVTIFMAVAIYIFASLAANAGSLFHQCSAPCRYHVSSKTLGQVIDQYGPPVRKAAYFVPGDERYQIVSVTLFYADIGMTVSATRRDVNVIRNVDRDFQVDEVAFWQSRTLEDIGKEFQRLHVPEATHLLVWSEDWNGFGPVTVH